MTFRATWLALRVLSLICASTLLVAFGAAPEAAVDSEQDAAYFVERINELRTELGLVPLESDPELVAEANEWTRVMAASDELAHSSDITAGISAPWILLGENVGVHQVHELDQLFQAFVDSPPHYNNLVEPRYRYIGIGVVNTPEGTIWTTQRFMAVAPDLAQDEPDLNSGRWFLDLCRASRGLRQLN